MPPTPLKIRLRAVGLRILRFVFAHLPRSPRKKNILLDCSSSALSASYLEDLRQLFADDPRIRFFKFVRPLVPAADKVRCLATMSCPEMPYRQTKYYPWDLVVLADHPEEQVEHRGRYGVLRISHGVGGKLVDGHDYMYGPRLYGSDGKLRYTHVFEASETRRNRYVAANPDLRGVVRLVGDLRIDKLMQASNRALSRAGETERPSVLIASSWSQSNLFEQLGRGLLTEAAGLLDRYAFVLRPHPHMLKSSAKGNWKDYFAAQQKLGFVFSPPTEELDWLLAATRVVICDDLSSLVLYAAVLGKRIILVPSGSAQIPADSFPARLARLVPNLRDPAELPALLAEVMCAGPAAGLAELAAEINSRPGESARLIRREIYQAINLPPPSTPARAVLSAPNHPPTTSTVRAVQPSPVMISRKVKNRLKKLLPDELVKSYPVEYRWYPHPLSWLVRVYDRTLRRSPRSLLPGRKAVTKLRFRGMTHPFYVRLGSSDLQLHQTIRYRGEYAPVLQDKFAGPIRQVIDLGANAGYTVRLWRELFPEARLIAVEPDPGNLALCRLNALSLPGGRVDFIEACVDGASGTVWLDRSEAEHQFHMTSGPTSQAIEVPALTVAQILEQAKADEEIGLLKCDVQGAEKAIFADCGAWIHRVKNMIVEVHPPYGPDDLIADLQRHGWIWQRHVAHRTDDLWVLFFWGDGQSAATDRAEVNHRESAHLRGQR